MTSQTLTNKGQLISKVLEFARREIGVREVGENRGKRVQQYQADTTLGGTGWPWCAAFVAWTLDEAFDFFGLKNIWNNSASCDVLLSWGRSHDLDYHTPQVGDVFLVMASHYDATHTGIVTTVNGAQFSTVEGNTNLDGGREGVGVFARERTNSSRYLFIRWANLFKQPESGYTLIVGPHRVPVIMRNGRAYVWSREWGGAFGFEVEWNADHQSVLYDGQESTVEVIQLPGPGVDGKPGPLRGYQSVRKLAEKLQPPVTIQINEQEKLLRIVRVA